MRRAGHEHGPTPVIGAILIRKAAPAFCPSGDQTNREWRTRMGASARIRTRARPARWLMSRIAPCGEAHSVRRGWELRPGLLLASCIGILGHKPNHFASFDILC